MRDFDTYCDEHHVRLHGDTLTLVEPELSIPTPFGFRKIAHEPRVITRFTHDAATNTLASSAAFKTSDKRFDAFPTGRPFAIRGTPERWLEVLETCARHVAKSTGATHFELPSGRNDHDLLSSRGYVKQGRAYRYRRAII